MFKCTTLKRARLSQKISEAELAARAGLSRLTLRSIESGQGNPTWDSIETYAGELGFNTELLLTSKESEIHSEDSIAGISLFISAEGLKSWPLYLMNFVDAYRRTNDARLIALGPVSQSSHKLKALLASTVLCLCYEAGTSSPNWSNRSYFLDTPWFPSESESLKAMALLESPLFFRMNNIFVLENFLKRA